MPEKLNEYGFILEFFNSIENYYKYVVFAIAGFLGLPVTAINILIGLMLIDTFVALIKVRKLKQKFSAGIFMWKYVVKFTFFLIPLTIVLISQLMVSLSKVESEVYNFDLVMGSSMAIFGIAQAISILKHIKTIRTGVEDKKERKDIISKFISAFTNYFYIAGEKLIKVIERNGGCDLEKEGEVLNEEDKEENN